MDSNNSKREYRHTSLRLDKKQLAAFKTLCATIGVNVSTGLRWLVETAIQKGSVEPPKKDLPK